jgi:aminomethyltransferase
MLKQTSLIEAHKRQGAKLVEFAGWEMPVQYSGIIAEHNAVREAAGVFDVSHMGEILVSGPEAQDLIDFVTPNDVKSLYDGKAQYSALTNERGGVVDDIIIYRESKTKFMLCVNAANTRTAFEWIVSKNIFEAEVKDVSDTFGQIAVQGPKAIKILSSLFPEIDSIKPFHFHKFGYRGGEVMVARTGYTGEDGAELFIPQENTEAVFEQILEAGKGWGLVPAGLGARDSLRLEACYPLHGHELAVDISALESGLGWIVKLDKGEFIGKAALLAEKERGIARSLVAFLVDDRGIARHGDKVFNEAGQEIGIVTSGTRTPTVGAALGLALLKSEYKALGSRVYAEVRGKKLACQVVKKPFFKRSY